MAIPPFPSQDLAKLVLGYLSEEQLMTAYDEFLQASPYLDAHINEYDRIFMTSLRNILAEFWALKINVESCQPLVLRKRLLQCSNLLSAFRLLVSIADISKLQVQEASEKASVKISVSNLNQPTKESDCNVCMTSNSTICTCQDNHISRLNVTSDEKPILESSVEATAVETLPGNVTSRNEDEKSNKTHTALLNTEDAITSNLAETQRVHPTTDNNNRQKYERNDVIQISSSVTKSSDCIEKIEEFNNIFNKVCENKSSASSGQTNVLDNINEQVSNTVNLHEYSNVDCHAHASNVNQNGCVPLNTTAKDTQNAKSIGKVYNTTSNITTVSKPVHNINPSTQKWFTITPETRQKDSKIKIISDIKVDNHVATSQPLLQTIRINGTPIYRQKPPKSNFTSDEIMAMPTLILVPATGPPSTVSQTQPKPSISKDEEITNTVAAEPVLGPLVIDVSSNSTSNRSMPSIPQPGPDTGLVKTIDVKNASVPKDNTIANAIETSTPHVLPPTRKSSSTPRRNSHIRVLDFTAPRRILQETIQENVVNTASSIDDCATKDTYEQASENVHNTENIVNMSSVTVHKIECPSNFKLKPVKEVDKKKNWDADLRALLASGETQNNVVEKKPIKTKKKKVAVDKTQNKKETETNAKKLKAKSPKTKEKRKQKPKEENEDDVNIIKNPAKVPVKPTIKVIPGDALPTSQESVTKNTSNSTNDSKNESDSSAPKEKDNVSDEIVLNDNKKSNSSDEVNETPEAERLCLQNVIGVKLNISELLETPYKQALYDIQMETPKFLGPDLPGEPISDIKIMSIPTPRFFDSPKPAQATPSSYSSRPTDYSSGGSYYKPDDHDYIPIPEIDCPMVSIPESVIESPNDKENKENKKTRPVRKCAKNVSYSLNQNTSNKTKNNEKNDVISVSSNLQSSHKADDNKCKTKTPQSNISKSQPKSVNNKRSASGRRIAKSSMKYKSPIKKSNSFIKIRPRQPTPVKLAHTKSNRKPDRSRIGSSTKPPSRISGKDQTIKNSPVTTSLPTKSRRKSSTPRKLHCSKSFNSESSGQDSPEVNRMNPVKETATENKISISHDSDTEQLALRWSDDGSQDSKAKRTPISNESEDILKIQEYINTTTVVHTTCEYDPKGSFHKDLIIRGFDAETAKIIERDLLDTPPHSQQQCQVRVEIIQSNKVESTLDKSVETSSSCTTNLLIDQGEDTEEDDIELSVYDCDEESNNYVVTSHDYAKEPFVGLPIKLKDKFSIEICIDDGNPIRLRATDFALLVEQKPQHESELDYRETEQAVQSICNIDRLYTPLKDPTKVRCYEIFDSTLTSLDTPLKAVSPKPRDDEVTEIEIIVDEDCTDRTDTRKRKRVSSNSPEHESNDNKKNKSEAQYLLNSTHIQNIDIETVLTKLHGP